MRQEGNCIEGKAISRETLLKTAPLEEGMAGKRGQVSLEYLMILGMTLAVLIPASYLFYDYSQGSNSQVVRGQIDSVAANVLTQASAMYSLGKGNRITLDLTIPSSVQNITILDNAEIVITYRSPQGLQDAVFFSTTNITGVYNLDGTPCIVPCSDTLWSTKPVASGAVQLKIESQGAYVTLNQTN